MATSGIPGLNEAYQQIEEGSLSGSDRDGVRSFPTLPFTREFRAEIIECTFRNSNAGNPGLRLKYAIQEEGSEFDGQFVWDSLYFTGHAFQGQRLAVLLASNSVPLPEGPNPLGELESIAPSIVGGRIVLLLKPGNDPSYPAVRDLKVDRGQSLRMNVKPPVSRDGSNADLDASIPGLPKAAATADVPSDAPVETGVRIPTAPAIPQLGIRLPNVPT